MRTHLDVNLEHAYAPHQFSLDHQLHLGRRLFTLPTYAAAAANRDLERILFNLGFLTCS